MSADWYCRFCSHYTSSNRCTCDDKPADKYKDKNKEFKPFEPKPEKLPIVHETAKVLKVETCKTCGEITRERYRQMKAMNRRRWQQVQALEVELSHFSGGNMDDKGNIGTLGSFEKTYYEELTAKGVPAKKQEALVREKLAKLAPADEHELAALLNMTRNERRLWFKAQKKG